MDKSQNPTRFQSKIAEFQDPDASELKFPENAFQAVLILSGVNDDYDGLEHSH